MTRASEAAPSSAGEAPLTAAAGARGPWAGACVVVQCHHTDLIGSPFSPPRRPVADPHDPALYAVGPLRGLPMILAAPDTPENRAALPPLATRWNVALHLGEEHDVVARLLGAAAAMGASRIARVTLPAFFADPALVSAQLARLDATDADYCTLPRDVDVRFGADVCTVAALAAFGDPGAAARYRPWPYLERTARTVVCDIEPHADVDAIRAHPAWPERAGPGSEGGEYDALARLLGVGRTHAVLDAGCGHGEIAAILARHAGRVVGVDRDERAIGQARARFPGIGFHAGALPGWTTDERFDLILHCHTLEHLPEPTAALDGLKRLLKPGGRLAVEVPLELRTGVINPHHEREYTVARLRRELRAAGLTITAEHGVARGLYGAPETAREAYLAVAAP